MDQVQDRVGSFFVLAEYSYGQRLHAARHRCLRRWACPLMILILDRMELWNYPTPGHWSQRPRASATCPWHGVRPNYVVFAVWSPRRFWAYALQQIRPNRPSHPPFHSRTSEGGECTDNSAVVRLVGRQGLHTSNVPSQHGDNPCPSYPVAVSLDVAACRTSPVFPRSRPTRKPRGPRGGLDEPKPSAL